MKKKLTLLFTCIFVLVTVLGVLVACKDKVTVTIPENQKSLVMGVGDNKVISATTSDGSEIEWSSDNTAVATVADNGRITAVSAGKAIIKATAKGTDCSDTCEVTVVGITFSADGSAVSGSISIVMGTSTTLTIETTDSSTVESWSSNAPDVASVEGGVVTGIVPGSAKITVKTSSGVSASVSITVTAKDGYQAMTPDTKEPGQWYYYTSSEGGRATDVLQASYDAETGVATYNFTGNGNWYIDDIQLGHRAPAGSTAGWKKLTGKIKASNITTTDGASSIYNITIFSTTITITEGETTFTVFYNQEAGGDDLFIRFAGEGCLISGGEFAISDLKWADHTPSTLTTPSFTIDGDKISITDGVNADYSVNAYQIGLFDANGNIIHTQNFTLSGGAIDTSSVVVTSDTVCTVKIKALAEYGYNDSAWSETSYQYTVKANSVRYEMDGAGESTANKNAGTWTYWAGDGGQVVSAPVYDNGTITLESDYLGWAWYGVQLFCKYGQYTTGTPLKISMDINSTHAGRMTITGKAIDIKEGDNHIEIYVNSPAGATISIQFGVNGEDNNLNWGGSELQEVRKFVLTNIVVEEDTTGGGNQGGGNQGGGNTPAPSGDFINGGETDAVANKDLMYYWNDQNWCGSNVKVSEAKYADGAYTFTYSNATTACWFGFQMFYKNAANVAGSSYTVSFTLESSVAGTIRVNGKLVEISAGTNNISVTYTESAGEASLSIQFGVQSANGGGNTAESVISGGTFTLSGLTFTAA